MMVMMMMMMMMIDDDDDYYYVSFEPNALKLVWSRLMVMSFCGLTTTLFPVNTQLSWHKRKGMPRYVWDVGYVVICNDNGTM